MNLTPLTRPRAIINFAAESHVDRSIDDPTNFIQTNIVDTFHLLEVARMYMSTLLEKDKAAFRFLHVSTDEVYGALERDDPPFKENNAYAPNSPYSASKAASDHLVRAYHHTYGMPILTTNCSNNYGPFQFPEKLVPLIIQQAIVDKPLPIYGDGKQIRDWLYVGDHCRALLRILDAGKIGQTYNIGGRNEKNNLEIVYAICHLLDKLKPRADGKSYAKQIIFIKDRPGHDRRYAINANKLEQELGWSPVENFETGLYKTVSWYLEQQERIIQHTSNCELS